MAAIASFEEEILSLNPEYDLVFNKNDENIRNDQNQSPNALEPCTRSRSSPYKMKIISTMNEIINAKPIGELPTENDWEDHDSTEKETITLMRKLGLEQSIDRPPDEKRTIATVPTSEDIIFMKTSRKRIPIFMADTYFELKPRSEPSFDLDDIVPPASESTTSDFSDDVNQYQPIFDSTLETDNTSLSEGVETKSPSRFAYKPLDSGVSSDSGKRMSMEAEKSRRRSHQEDRRRSNNTDRSNSNSKRLNQSASSSSSSRSNTSWRDANGSFSEMRDENNWRIKICKAKKPAKTDNNNNNHQKYVEQKVLNQTITLSKEELKPTEVISCTGRLYKPKDLFMKKKAMMIQQVLAEYQS